MMTPRQKAVPGVLRGWLKAAATSLGWFAMPTMIMTPAVMRIPVESIVEAAMMSLTPNRHRTMSMTATSIVLPRVPRAGTTCTTSSAAPLIAAATAARMMTM